jgi:hypothetical protein
LLTNDNDASFSPTSTIPKHGYRSVGLTSMYGWNTWSLVLNVLTDFSDNGFGKAVSIYNLAITETRQIVDTFNWVLSDLIHL